MKYLPFLLLFTSCAIYTGNKSYFCTASNPNGFGRHDDIHAEDGSSAEYRMMQQNPGFAFYNCRENE